MKVLRIRAGPTAERHIAEHGLAPAHVADVQPP
jgi:hypothetical protein